MEVKYMTAQEISDGIDREDPEILNGVISGAVKVGEAGDTEEGAPEFEERPAQAVVEDTVEQPIESVEQPVGDVNNTQEDDISSKMNALLAERRAEKEERELEKAKAKQDLADSLREKNELKKALEEAKSYKKSDDEEVVENTQSILEEDEDDIALAGNYAKNNRTMLEDIKKSLGEGGNAEVLEKLNAIEARENERLEKINKAEADKEAAESKQRIYDEVDKFQSGNETYKTEKSMKILGTEFSQFKGNVAEYMGEEATGADVERAIYAAIEGTTENDNEFRDKLGKAGIPVPKEMDKFLTMAKIIDLQGGFKFNPITGKYDAITDANGNQVTYKSIDEAYKLSNYSKNISSAKNEAALAYQQKIDNRDASATRLSNSDTTNKDGSEDFNAKEIDELLDVNPREYRNNPALKAKVVRAYAQLNMVAPD